MSHGTRSHLRIFLSVVILMLGRCLSARAQTYEVIHAFSRDDGSFPYARLLQVGADFYGTTENGGDDTGLCSAGCGTVFKLDASNHLTTLHAFDSATDGIFPAAGLILASDGNFYGTTVSGGLLGDGTVFQINALGTVATLHDFDRDTGGWFTRTPVIQGLDGNLYGTTTFGPCDDESDNCGVVYQLTLAGDYTPLHTFDTDLGGRSPLSPILQTSSTDFYGTTSQGGGANPGVCGTGCGTVFHMSSSGTVTTLHAFGFDDGSAPIGALMQGTDGFLYGVTAMGGDSNKGTIYRVDAQGNFNSLHSFDGTDGQAPWSGLVQANDGLFYGITEFEGQFGNGALYRMDSAGNVIVVHHFDGSGQTAPQGLTTPTAELIQGSDGSLYGARRQEGSFGVVFRFTPAPASPLYCPNNFVRRDQMAVFLLKTEHGSSFTPPACLGVFPDVACPSLFADWIEDLASEGITAGCGGGDYCPLSAITREQMAVFLLKTEHGAAFTPPACTGVFPDVPCTSLFAPWIEALASEGVTAGCGGGNFCPATAVTRAQMAVFLLKMEHGSSYVPPACAPLFGDVLCPSLFADWIEQLFAEGITAGCSS